MNIRHHLIFPQMSGADILVQNNNWFSGSNHLTYYLQDAWISSTYTSTYTKAYASWKKNKRKCRRNGKYGKLCFSTDFENFLLAQGA